MITYTLTLFDDANPTRELAARTIQQPLTVVGRDPTADWVVEDEDCYISRCHLQFRIIAGLLFVRPLGRNGAFIGTPPQKIPDDVEVLIEAGHSLARTANQNRSMRSAKVLSLIPLTSSRKTRCDS